MAKEEIEVTEEQKALADRVVVAFKGLMGKSLKETLRNADKGGHDFELLATLWDKFPESETRQALLRLLFVVYQVSSDNEISHMMQARALKQLMEIILEGNNDD